MSDKNGKDVFINKDVASYTSHYLKRFRTNQKFEELDFTNAQIEVINELFPTENGRGTLDPPVSYLTSASRIRVWRRLGQKARESELARAVTDKQNSTNKRLGQKRRKPHSCECQEAVLMAFPT